MQLSSSVPSPSGDRLQLARQVGELRDVVGVDRLELGEVRRLVLVVRDRWWPSVTPTMRYFCSLPSRPNMKVQMRVTSVWNASTIRSHIRRMCSVRSAGTPVGPGDVVGQHGRRSGSARAIRCSSSRTPDRYWSSFCRSLPPSLPVRGPWRRPGRRRARWPAVRSGRSPPGRSAGRRRGGRRPAAGSPPAAAAWWRSRQESVCS